MRKKTGVVVSAKMDKTIVVLVHTYEKHPVYGKSYRKSNKFVAHDEANVCVEGDSVVIEESRPLSARKRWALVSREGIENVDVTPVVS